MENKNKKIEKIKKKILPILRSYNVERAGFFGSLAKGDLNKDSDIDILVEINSDLSLLDFVGLKLELEEATGRKVDLVEYSTIKPALEKYIFSQEVQII